MPTNKFLFDIKKNKIIEFKIETIFVNIKTNHFLPGKLNRVFKA